MPAFDPYMLLGLTRAASAAAIKSAYRQRVQTAHPDRGGDADGFIALVRAFAVLSDPDSRRLFDETGIVDDDRIRDFRKEVTILLAEMFDAAVAAAVATRLDLDRVDFVAQMGEAVQTGLADARRQLLRKDREIESLIALRHRIRRTAEGANLFATRLDAQIGSRTAEHASIKRRILILETAVVELGNYSSEVELIAALEASG